MADGTGANTQQVQCPECEIGLVIPRGYAGRKVRCGRCHHRFFLPDPESQSVTDATVADWLGEEPDEPGPEETQVLESQHVSDAAAPVAENTAKSTATKLAKLAVGDRALDVLKIERKGVLVQFPAERLNDTAFRAAMPRRCMQCGSRIHLEAHVVIFSAALVSSVSLEAERSAGKMVLGIDEVRDLSPEQLLARLPIVPNVPPPADQPMPYWLCDMCGKANAVSGQLLGGAKAGEERCRLLIRNLWRAQEFVKVVGGKGTAAYAKVTDRIAQTTENPWDTLPLTIQHRIEQWYKPVDGEKFLAYVPDRDRTRTEDGMAGLLLSTARLICHTSLRHREVTADQPLEFWLSTARGGGNLKIHSPIWQVKRLRVDKDGLARLRRALVKGKFTASWR